MEGVKDERLDKVEVEWEEEARWTCRRVGGLLDGAKFVIIWSSNDDDDRA